MTMSSAQYDYNRAEMFRNRLLKALERCGCAADICEACKDDLRVLWREDLNTEKFLELRALKLKKT